MATKDTPKVSRFTDDYAAVVRAGHAGQSIKVTYPAASMTADMQFILDGLQDGIAAAQNHVKFTQQRYNAYVVQCAEVLGVNSPRFMFNADTRTFTDNPNYKEPEPHQ